MDWYIISISRLINDNYLEGWTQRASFGRKIGWLMTTSDIRILPATVHQGQEEEICLFLEAVQRSRGSRYTRRLWTSVSTLSQRRSRLSQMKRSAGPLFCQLPVQRRSSFPKCAGLASCHLWDEERGRPGEHLLGDWDGLPATYLLVHHFITTLTEPDLLVAFYSFPHFGICGTMVSAIEQLPHSLFDSGLFDLAKSLSLC